MYYVLNYSVNLNSTKRSESAGGKKVGDVIPMYIQSPYAQIVPGRFLSD